MKISILTADYASVDGVTGKLNILGVFQNIWAADFPCRHRRMYLAVLFEGEYLENRDGRQLAVALADLDGKEIIRIEGTFAMPSNAPGIPSEHNAIFEFNDIVFQKPGDYTFFVEVSGNETETIENARRVIQVRQQEAQ